MTDLLLTCESLVFDLIVRNVLFTLVCFLLISGLRLLHPFGRGQGPVAHYYSSNAESGVVVVFLTNKTRAQ